MKPLTVNLTHISTYPILIELRDRIKHTNALELQSFDDIVELRDLLTEHLTKVHNPYIFDPKTSAKFVAPHTPEAMLEWARKVNEWVCQRDAEWTLNNDQPSREG